MRHADGRPAAGILIRAEGHGATNHYCRMHTRSGEDGSYSFDVHPDQSYMIAVLDDRWGARSLSGVLVREEEPRGGLDITLSAGTLIHGVVTKRGGGAPLKGETITLVEHGQNLPAALGVQSPNATAESLPQWARTDSAGRYQLRVGPGRYTLSGSGDEAPGELNVEMQSEIVSDFRVAESSEWRSLTGVAIEKAPTGERAIPGAMIEAAPIGRHGAESRTVADTSGRFELSVAPGQALAIYTRDPERKLAGITPVGADANDVRTFASPASRISGKVLDAAGRPVLGRAVTFRLETGRDFHASARFSQRTKTDAAGRYEFRGAAVGRGPKCGCTSTTRTSRPRGSRSSGRKCAARTRSR